MKARYFYNKHDKRHYLEFITPTGYLSLPVITSGSRDDTGCWTWNGDLEKPTLKPSIKQTGHSHMWHCWLNDGVMQMLDDSDEKWRGMNYELPGLEANNE